MFGIICLGIATGFVTLELVNYIYYRKSVNFVNQKTLDDHIDNFDKEWIKKFWLVELEPEEIKTWIIKTMCYDNGTNDIDPTIDTFVNIPRSKMLKWLSYHLFFKSFKTLSSEQLADAEIALSMLEDKIQYKFSDGQIENIDKKLYTLKFGSTKINTTYKPLILYTTFGTVKNFSYIYLKHLGFTKHTMNKTNMVYFHYQKPENKGRTIMFIHGLGFGITPYLGFIRDLTSYADVIVPILPNISNMEFNSIFSGFTNDNFFPHYQTIRDDFYQVINELDLYDITVIGHSFGTIILSVLLKHLEFSKRVNKKVFIDPVCFIDDSHKIFNYIKNPDDKGSMLISLFNNIVYKDVYVRYATQRFLYGPEYWIFDYNSLTNNTIVLLSGEDKIVPALTLYKKLSKYGIPCIYVENAGHADVFNVDEFIDVVDMVKNYSSVDLRIH